MSLVELRRLPLRKLVTVGTLTSIAWSAFAFGAVYSWAYVPLLVIVTVLAGTAALLAHLAEAPSPSSQLGISMAITASVIAFQLVPLQPSLVHGISPKALTLVSQLRISAPADVSESPLSIRPESTRLALLFIVVLGTAFWYLSRAIAITGVKEIALGLTVIGVILAVDAIVQRGAQTQLIYGLWRPEGSGYIFGPFVNRNHFAGWMAMALPVVLGLTCGQLAVAMARVKRTLRDRVLWFSSPQASQLIGLIAATSTMLLSLALSFSKSGIVCLAIALLLAMGLSLRRLKGSRRILTVVYLAALVGSVLIWVGPATFARAFREADWVGYEGRLGASEDALSVFADFPIAGTGLNTYGDAMLIYQRHDLASHYSTAHNDYLQLAAEGGVALLVPASLALLLFWRESWRRFSEHTKDIETRWIRAGAVIGLIAIALQESVDFSLQIPGNAVLFVVVAAIAVHKSGDSRHAVSAELAR